MSWSGQSGPKTWEEALQGSVRTKERWSLSKSLHLWWCFLSRGYQPTARVKAADTCSVVTSILTEKVKAVEVSQEIYTAFYRAPAWREDILTGLLGCRLWLGDAGDEVSVSDCCFFFASAWVSRGLFVCMYLIRAAGNCGVWSHCFSALLLITTLDHVQSPFQRQVVFVYCW